MQTALFKNIKRSILADLKNAKVEINIAVAWFTNHEFYNVLLKKIREGVKVNLIIINDPINNREGGLNWQEFINQGGNLYFSQYPRIMHHKFCIIDNQILYNGSYNWTYYAEGINRENTVRHTDSDDLIFSFQEEFKRLKIKNKLYKKVRRYSLDELLQFQIEKVLHFYISKELAANSRWLVKNKELEIAKKVIEASITFSSKKEQERLEPVKTLINSLSHKSIRSQRIESDLDRRLKDIAKQETRLKAQIVSRQTIMKSLGNISAIQINQNKLQDLKREQQLIKNLKKDKLKGDFGDLRINLKWETYDDLDLHVFDPENNHISFSEKEAFCNGSKGQLDVDANAGAEKLINPQENIFWETNPPSGIYKIFVVHYAVKKDNEVPFILTISPKIGKSETIYAKVHHLDLKTMLVAEIKYVREEGVTEIITKRIPAVI
ncbi:MAG: hypothetical protein EOP48_12335 [Sphingobacteriales bacterium]|nr:MAG: hypothetical protein EOP48_12335 [Sphingobacteriales bacterium]